MRPNKFLLIFVLLIILIIFPASAYNWTHAFSLGYLHAPDTLSMEIPQVEGDAMCEYLYPSSTMDNTLYIGYNMGQAPVGCGASGMQGYEISGIPPLQWNYSAGYGVSGSKILVTTCSINGIPQTGGVEFGEYYFPDTSLCPWINDTVQAPRIFNLYFIPSSIIKYGESTLMHITDSEGYIGISVISYYTKDTQNFESQSLIVQYRKNDDASWSKRNSTSEFELTGDNPFLWVYTPETYGNKTITGLIYEKLGTYPAQYLSLINTSVAILTVQPPILQPLVPIYLSAVDIYTGSHLSNVSLNLTDHTLGDISRTWNNVIYQQSVTLNAYDYCTLSAHLDGYTDNSISFIVPLETGSLLTPQNPPHFDQYISVQLTPTYINPNPNNFTMIIEVSDSVTTQKIPNFKVSLVPVNRQFFSDAIGNDVIILLPFNQTYTFTVSATGYQSQGQNFGTWSMLTLKKLTFNLIKTAVTIIPTPIPTYTTPYPTPTPYINVTGGVIINGNYCKYSTNLIESIDFMLCTQAGIEDKTTLGIVKAVMIIIAFNCIFLYLGRNSDSLGTLALIASVLGFVVSLVLGFIELWVLLALLGLGFLAILVLRRGEG